MFIIRRLLAHQSIKGLFMFKRKALILFVAILLTGCKSTKNFGPFEVVLKTEDDKKVEDVIVILHQFGLAALKGSKIIYWQTKVVNSEEVITYPRGAIQPGETGKTYLSAQIYHPYYQTVTGALGTHFYFEGSPEGIIRLQDVQLVSKKTARAKSMNYQITQMEKNGESAEKIEEAKHRYRLHSPGSLYSSLPIYFHHVLKMGREDLVDKYLHLMLKDIKEHQGKDDIDIKALEKDVRQRIEKMKIKLDEGRL